MSFQAKQARGLGVICLLLIINCDCYMRMRKDKTVKLKTRRHNIQSNVRSIISTFSHLRGENCVEGQTVGIECTATHFHSSSPKNIIGSCQTKNENPPAMRIKKKVIYFNKDLSRFASVTTRLQLLMAVVKG